ncbi:MAG: hypothetical protein MK212_17880, partial [Saprospiraceae bacterium]|nr:hypothetical protein [Saprospiraceae bacterium]
MINSSNPIHKRTGAGVLAYPLYLCSLFLFLWLVAKGISKNWIITVGAIVGLSGGLWYLLKVFQNPRIGAWSVLVYSFTWSLIARYVSAYTGLGIQFGLGIDGLLALSLVAMLFGGGANAPYGNMRNALMLLTLLWFFFILLQLFNPHASSRLAWVFTVRGYALYILVTIMLCNMLLNRREDLDLFLIIFVGFSILGALY